MRIARPRLTLTLLAALAVLGATAAVALGAPARSTDNRSDLQHAFTKTSKATSGHFSFTASVSGGATASAGAITISGSGGFDTKSKSAQLTVNLGALSSLLGSLAGGASVPSTLDVVVTNNTVYVHLPAIASKQQKGAEWLKFTSSSVPSSITGGVKVKPNTVNPQQTLAALTKSVSVHKLGSSTVRGSSATHYRVVVNTAALIKTLPKSQQASSQKALTSMHLKTVPIDVYVDHHGYVTRVSANLSHLVVQKGSPAVGIKFSVDLYDFGTPVHVTAPPASKTVDGSKLLAGLGGSNGGK
jgi:hypothetical protein